MTRKVHNTHAPALGAAVFLMLLTVCLYSCTKPPAPAARPAGSVPLATTSAPGASPPAKGESSGSLGEPFKGWPAPAALFVLTGQQHGYLEPCGCSVRQSGGMARRADLLRQIREVKGWPVTALDVGGTLLESRTGRIQTSIKYDAILKGLDALGYNALELGLEDMLLGWEKLYTAEQTLAAVTGDNRNMPLMAANVMLVSEDVGTPVKFKTIQVGSVKVAVTGVVGSKVREKLAATGILADSDLIRVDDPLASLPPVLESMKSASPDLLVLLSHCDLEESKQLAERFPEFHLVVTAGGPEDPPREPEYVGQTMVVQVGMKGKSAMAVGYFPGAEQKLRLELLELDADRFKKDPSMKALMEDYQGQLESRWSEVLADSTISDKTARFVGVDQCKVCHTHAFKVWSTTKHAHALDILVTGRKGEEHEWVPRLHDPECLACHTTGWEPQEALRYESGFADKESTPHLTGNQCENCHGPGSTHVELENVFRQSGKITAELQAARKSMDLDVTMAREKVCIRCHDHENSPTFNFDERWPKVMHSGKKD